MFVKTLIYKQKLYSKDKFLTCQIEWHECLCWKSAISWHYIFCTPFLGVLLFVEDSINSACSSIFYKGWNFRQSRQRIAAWLRICAWTQQHQSISSSCLPSLCVCAAPQMFHRLWYLSRHPSLTLPLLKINNHGSMFITAHFHKQPARNNRLRLCAHDRKGERRRRIHR